MPRRSAAAVADTRAEVLDVALRRASIDGLEGLTIGRLAEEASMSKSGLHGLFGSKEELQVATFDAAVTEFTREVWEPVSRRPAGRVRLLALIDRWLAYHRRRVLPGGCFVTTATIEFDARPGSLRDAIIRVRRQMHGVIESTSRPRSTRARWPRRPIPRTWPSPCTRSPPRRARRFSSTSPGQAPARAARCGHCCRFHSAPGHKYRRIWAAANRRLASSSVAPMALPCGLPASSPCLILARPNTTLLMAGTT